MSNSPLEALFSAPDFSDDAILEPPEDARDVAYYDVTVRSAVKGAASNEEQDLSPLTERLADGWRIARMGMTDVEKETGTAILTIRLWRQAPPSIYDVAGRSDDAA
ncbi:hypothetical protein [Salisaeta longa]|uniref:hypothetical protein n=1 Tax=Salisaeta longa TaxID=503170 RepID=UPI0003B5AA95|nr:hypothetical protein [Salisaeta longa]